MKIELANNSWGDRWGDRDVLKQGDRDVLNQLNNSLREFHFKVHR
jgi:hypothetical protein